MASSLRHRTQHHWMSVGAAVALDADRADVGQQHDGELPDLGVKTGAGQLVARDRVCRPQRRRAARG